MAITRINPIPISERPILQPFTILVDSAEQLPFAFQGMRSDANQHYRPIIVDLKNPAHWRRQCLGRNEQSCGDYSLEFLHGGQLVSLVGELAIERKSVQDFQSTVLGFADGRHSRFCNELANLSTMTSAVFIEGPEQLVLSSLVARGSKPVEAIRKTLRRSIESLRQDFKVHFIFCKDREDAERRVYYWLTRKWKKKKDELKRAAA